jgi:hypothetical protein
MIGELNDIGVTIFCVLIGLDVWFTYKIYKNEYKDTKDKREGE